MGKLNYCLLIIWLIIFTSCNTYKNVPYFQDTRRPVQTEAIDNYSPITVQPGDMLAITVTSSNPTASATFNGSSANGTSSNEDKGYLVDRNGNINLPLIGIVKVSNLTLPQVHDLILPKLGPYLQSPILDVSLSNFRFSVIGDVTHPGLFHAPTENLNFIQALSIAGDLDITARRENVLLIRETNGNREFVTIDLTSNKLFHSPYYYLRNNDIIYVTPDKTKYTAVSRSRSNLTLLVTLVSAAALVISIVRH